MIIQSFTLDYHGFLGLLASNMVDDGIAFSRFCVRNLGVFYDNTKLKFRLTGFMVGIIEGSGLDTSARGGGGEAVRPELSGGAGYGVPTVGKDFIAPPNVSQGGVRHI